MTDEPLFGSISLTLTTSGPNRIILRTEDDYVGTIHCPSKDAQDFLFAFLGRLVREASDGK